MKAMILAAGYGKRLRPLTLTTPKPLIPVAGKPLIVHHIERLVAAGINELVINHSWLGEQIEQQLGNGQHWGATIHYSREATPLETGGGIRQALPLLGDQAPFLVVNGDVFTDVNYRTLTLPDNQLAHLVMVDNPTFHPDGDFFLHHGVLYNACAEPDSQRLTFSGVSILSPQLFRCAPQQAAFRLASILRPAMDAGQVSGQHHQGLWSDVGSPDRLNALNHMLTQRTMTEH